MPRIDLNPLESGGTVELFSTEVITDGAKMIVGIAVFLTLVGFGDSLADWLSSELSQLLGLKNKRAETNSAQISFTA